MAPRKLVETITLVTYVRIPAGIPTILITPWSLPSTFSTLNYSFIILPFYPQRPDLFWDPPSLLYNRSQVLFPWG
jgi:hypothetical protein